MTIAQAIEKLQANYPHGTSLYYVDYRDELTAEQATQVMKEWYVDWLFDSREISDAVDACIEDTFSKEERRIINEDEELRHAIVNWIYDKDDSTPLKDLCKNTGTVPVRITMYSNYDCINSMDIADLSYPESYLADVIDNLQINPRDVYNLIKDRMPEQKPRPNLKSRKPYISAKDMINELWENYGDGCWNFVATLDLRDVLGSWLPKQIIIPAGNTGWFFASWVWAWSQIEAPLLRDMTIDLTTLIYEWAPETYTVWNVYNDNDKDNSYNMSDVYWWTMKFYGEEIIVPKSDLSATNS